MDRYGHVNNVMFVRYLEEARVDLFDRLGRDEPWDMLDTGCLVHRHAITYRRPLAHQTAPVPIDVWVTRVGAAAFDLGYEIHDGAGTVYAIAETTLVPYDFAAERPRRLTDQEKKRLEALRDD
ncbi:MAG TPA: thioesterase family protein [Streptosporangiales bacterium]